MPDRQTPPPTHPFVPSVLPEIEPRHLGSGARLSTFSGGHEPVSCLTVYFQGGTAEARPAVASLAAAMLLEGAGDRNARALADALDFYGARVSPLIKEHHCGLGAWMLNDRAPQILALVGDILARPLFPETQFARVKAEAITRLKISDSRVSSVADQQARRMIMGPAHPGAHILTEDDIAQVNVDEVRDFHSRTFRTGGCHAFLSGMLDHKLSDLTADTLAALAPGPGAGLDVKPYRPEDPETTNISMPGAVQGALSAMLPAPPRSHPDYIPLRLTVMALGGYFGSRLMKNIREEKGLTYGISAYLAGSLDGSYINVALQCPPQHMQTVTDEISREMELMATNPPCGDELERLRLYASTGALEALDTPEGILSQYSTALVVGIPDGYFNRQQQTVAAITPEDMASMARKYLRPDQMRIAIAGPPDT